MGKSNVIVTQLRCRLPGGQVNEYADIRIEGKANLAILLKMHARTCMVCGCTDDDACLVEGVPCHWVAEDLCSACAIDPEDLRPVEPERAQ